MVKAIPILTFLYTVAIIFASLWKSIFKIFPTDLAHSDKYGHFLAYAILAMLWAAYLNVNKHVRLPLSLIISFLATVFFGFLMELAQLYFTTNRQYDYYDVIANSIGSLIGILVFFVYFRYNQKKCA